jgi:hypothetical protein
VRTNGHAWPEGTSALLRGVAAPGPAQPPGGGAVHRPRFGGLYTLPQPHCAPFRRMLAHPAVVERMNWMLGLGWNEVRRHHNPHRSLHAPHPGRCGL